MQSTHIAIITGFRDHFESDETEEAFDRVLQLMVSEGISEDDALEALGVLYWSMADEFRWVNA